MTSGQAISKLKHDKKYPSEVIKPLEKEHKALEIIKKYYVFEENQFFPFKRKNVGNTETKEEYDLLKEVLTNG